jgi:hypothetical protein
MSVSFSHVTLLFPAFSVAVSKAMVGGRIYRQFPGVIACTRCRDLTCSRAFALPAFYFGRWIHLILLRDARPRDIDERLYAASFMVIASTDVVFSLYRSSKVGSGWHVTLILKLGVFMEALYCVLPGRDWE